MTARRQRRLDGLAAPDRGTQVSPPPAARRPGDTPKQVTEPARAAEATKRSPVKRPAKKKPASSPAGRQRRAVSVPTPLAAQLRARAQQLDRFQTDLVLECLAALAPTLEDDHDRQRKNAAGPFGRPRRRALRGRTVTTLTLYLSQGEVAAIDDLASKTGYTRSRLITEALDHHLQEIS